MPAGTETKIYFQNLFIKNRNREREFLLKVINKWVKNKMLKRIVAIILSALMLLGVIAVPILNILGQ